jgi:hypothetical protein
VDPQRIIEDFVGAYRDGDEPKEDDARFGSIMELDDLACREPDTAWGLILAILERDQSSRVVGMLAAGPLEDLIEYHGPQFIDRIELRARQDPAFRHLLGGVWESSSPQVWARVETARGNKRW